MNKNVAITGGSSGIGAAVVERLLAAGCCVWNLDVAKNTSADIAHIHCDLAEPDLITSAVAELPDGLDGFINVAGIAPGRVDDLSVMAVNFLGMRHLVELILPILSPQSSVVIVASSAGRDWRENLSHVESLLNTASFADGIAWLHSHQGTWEEAAYRFSKQCAAAYTYRATGLARDRLIRVNCINPGIVETPLKPAFREMLGKEHFDYIVEQSGRAGQPDDIAAIAAFLLLGDCAWLNGIEITVDGGYHAGIVAGWIKPPA